MPSSPAAFLRIACTSLLVALAHAEEQMVVDDALAEHAAAHETWLQMIAATTDVKQRETLEALYHLHGRVAGRLEHHCPVPLPAHVERAVREMLGDELCELTSTAIMCLLEESLIPA